MIDFQTFILGKAGTLPALVVAGYLAVNGPITRVDKADVAAVAALDHVSGIAVVDEQLVAPAATEDPVVVEVEGVGVDDVLFAEAVYDVPNRALALVGIP